MENNKYYLQKLPVVFMLACALGLLFVFVPLIIPQYAGENNINFFYGFNYLYDILFFVSLGIITQKWLPALVNLGASAALYTLAIAFLYGKSYNMGIYLFSLLSTLGPMLLFLIMMNNRPRKLLTSLLLLLICVKSSYPNVFYANEGTIDFIFFEVSTKSGWHKVIMFFSAALPLVLQLIFFMEVLNHYDNKTKGWKPRLLNLGNEYPKTAGIILQVVLNAGLFIVLLNSVHIIRGNSYFNGYLKDLPQSVRITYLIQDISRSIAYLFYIVLYGWYYRKFLLEYFVSYNHTSRLLYWLCYIPVIGIVVFMAIAASATEQKTYTEKQTSLSLFAGSSSTSVAVILIILAMLRLAWAADTGQSILTVSAVISMLLLFWLIADKTGFFVNLYLNIATLAGLTIYSFFIERHSEDPLSIMYALVAVSTIMLIMLFPVLHIREFEYTPDKDPDPEIKEGGDLFPEYAPYR